MELLGRLLRCLIELVMGDIHAINQIEPSS